jgi:hypothetical protein
MRPAKLCFLLAARLWFHAQVVCVKPLASKISIETTPHEGVAGPVALEPPIPVLHITSLTAAAEFYVDFLGFKFDWGNDEPPAQHAYAQVSRDGVQLHLAEESEGGRPGALLKVRPNRLRCKTNRWPSTSRCDAIRSGNLAPTKRRSR